MYCFFFLYFETKLNYSLLFILFMDDWILKISNNKENFHKNLIGVKTIFECQE